MAAHFFGASRRPGGWRSTSRRAAATRTTSPRPRTRRSAARCKTALRAGVVRHPVDEGDPVKVAVCDYRAGNIRSVEIALRRLGARARRRRRRRRSRRAAGRRLGAARRWPSCAAQGLDDVAARAASPTSGRCSASASACSSRSSDSEEDGGVDGLGILPGRSVRLQGGPRAAHRLGRRGDRADGTAYYFAHSLRGRDAARDRVVGGHRRRGALGLRSSASSSIPRRAAPRARATSTACCGGEGAIPLPRLIPCLDVAGGRVVKGVKFQGLRDVGDPVELGAAYSDRGADELVFLDVKATLEERDTLVGVVRRVAEQLAIPFTVGGGIRSVGRRRCAALRRAPTRSRSTRPRSLGPSLITELAEKLGSQAVVVAIDTEGGRVRTRAGTTETAARRRSSGRVEARGARGGRDPAHVDRRRRHAGGLRPRDHARGRRRRCRSR